MVFKRMKRLILEIKLRTSIIHVKDQSLSDLYLLCLLLLERSLLSFFRLGDLDLDLDEEL